MSYGDTLVSVVTLTYRYFDGLYNTVDSVINQDYPNIEYVVYDDGSTDFPEDALKARIGSHFSRLKIHSQEKNVGTVRNINDAYRVAEGNIIINLSCGDIFYEATTVSKIVKRFEDTECNVLVTSRIEYGNSAICFLPHIEERQIIASFADNRRLYELFISGNHYDVASGSALSFDSSFIKASGLFDESYKLWEDGPFLQKYLWDNELELGYDIIAIWYKNDGVSHQPNRFMQEDVYNFNTNERLSHYKDLKLSLRRRLRYIKWQAIVKNRIVLRLIQLLFMPEVIENRFYAMRRKRFLDSDQKYISEQSIVSP